MVQTYSIVTEALVAILHGRNRVACIRTLLGTGRDGHALVIRLLVVDNAISGSIDIAALVREADRESSSNWCCT
jgi:hypothetical protein